MSPPLDMPCLASCSQGCWPRPQLGAALRGKLQQPRTSCPAAQVSREVPAQCAGAAAGKGDFDDVPPSWPLPARLRVLELFAGIGGWRVALRAALPADVELDVSAYDSGPHCSEVYERNFGEPCSRRNIEQLGVADLNGFDLWAMSPPCQPFSTTRAAKQRDIADKRCKALEHLCKTFPKLTKSPRWIVLENVKGFHGSEASTMWRQTLESMGFSCRQILLDLANFGVPNHRTRYYLLAERSARFRSAGGDATLSRGLTVTQAVDEHADEEDRAPPGVSNARKCAAVKRAAGAPQVLPPGLLLGAGSADGGEWVRARRREIEEAHSWARSSATRDDREAVFEQLRCRTAAHFETLLGQPGTGAPLVSAANPGWKLLPLPRGVNDAFLIVFEGGLGGSALQFFEQLSGLGAVDVRWSSTQDAHVKVQKPIKDFLEDASSEPDGDKAELIVSKAVLGKPFAAGLSYVQPSGTQSFCFTGHYGKVMHKSSGSLLHLPADGEALDRSNPSSAHGRVRFFDPKEILNLLGFPKEFTLGRDLELRHRYKVVGNSIAVTVASDLLRFLLLGEGGARLRRLEQAPPSE